MRQHDEIKGLLERTRFSVTVASKAFLVLLILSGIVSFVAGLAGKSPHIVWGALLANTVYFNGLALGGGDDVGNLHHHRCGLGLSDQAACRGHGRFRSCRHAFLPGAFWGMDSIFQWVDPSQVMTAKAGWLNLPFFIFRNTILLGFTVGLCWYYVKTSVRPDIGLAVKLGVLTHPFYRLFINNYKSQMVEEERSYKNMRVLTPVIALFLTFLWTLHAFDWIMSIDQEWYSTLFGLQYGVSNLLGACAALLVIAGIVRKKFHLEGDMTPERYGFLARLTFGFSILWTYMVFSQVLVIWYGDLPEETPYVLLRIQSLEWGWMFWLVIIFNFIVPFFSWISRNVCRSFRLSGIVAAGVLLGTWLEKYLLIAPGIQENYLAAADLSSDQSLPGVVFSIQEVLVTLGVSSVFVLCYLWFLQRMPAMPVSDHQIKQEENI